MQEFSPVCSLPYTSLLSLPLSFPHSGRTAAPQPRPEQTCNHTGWRGGGWPAGYPPAWANWWSKPCRAG